MRIAVLLPILFAWPIVFAQIREIPPDEKIQACVTKILDGIRAETLSVQSDTARAYCGNGGNEGGSDLGPKVPTSSRVPEGGDAPRTLLWRPSVVSVRVTKVALNSYKSPNWSWSVATYTAPTDFIIETMTPITQSKGSAEVFSFSVSPDKKSAQLQTRCKTFYSGVATGHLKMLIRRVPNRTEERAAYGRCIYGD